MEEKTLTLNLDLANPESFAQLTPEEAARKDIFLENSNRSDWDIDDYLSIVYSNKNNIDQILLVLKHISNFETLSNDDLISFRQSISDVVLKIDAELLLRVK